MTHHQRSAVPASARAALRLWSDAEHDLLIPRGSMANLVFAVRLFGATHFLRLTPRSLRRAADVTDEIAFLLHLLSAGAAVAAPVAARSGRLVEEVGSHFAVVFRRVPGLHVTPPDAHWNEEMFRAWGRAHARQHLAARGFCAPSSGWRQDWRREPILVDGLARLRAEDHDVALIADRVLKVLDAQRSSLGEEQMIHADMAPQNFRYHPVQGITAFDFDNACRHWLLYDLAVAKYALRLAPDRDRLFGWIVAGYQEWASLPGDPALLGLLLNLRLLYVHCDRMQQSGNWGPEILKATRDRLRSACA